MGGRTLFFWRKYFLGGRREGSLSFYNSSTGLEAGAAMSGVSLSAGGGCLIAR